MGKFQIIVDAYMVVYSDNIMGKSQSIGNAHVALNLDNNMGKFKIFSMLTGLYIQIILWVNLKVLAMLILF